MRRCASRLAICAGKYRVIGWRRAQRLLRVLILNTHATAEEEILSMEAVARFLCEVRPRERAVIAITQWTLESNLGTCVA